MYRAVNNNTIQQCITKVIMADVINHMYFNYFYNVSGRIFKNSKPVQMTCFNVFLLYLPLSLSQPFTVSRHGSWRWGWGSLSTLSLLHLILSPSFPFCFISSNLLPHSFPVGPLFGSVFFDLIHNILCLSLFSVPFCFTKFLSLMTSIKFFLLGFLECKEFSLSSLH